MSSITNFRSIQMRLRCNKTSYFSNRRRYWQIVHASHRIIFMVVMNGWTFIDKPHPSDDPNLQNVAGHPQQRRTFETGRNGSSSNQIQRVLGSSTSVKRDIRKRIKFAQRCRSLEIAKVLQPQRSQQRQSSSEAASKQKHHPLQYERWTHHYDLSIDRVDEGTALPKKPLTLREKTS